MADAVLEGRALVRGARQGRRGAGEPPARAESPSAKRRGGGGRSDGMSEVSAALVRELREHTGAGMMDCKKALAEVDGDLEKAIVFLREKGLAAAAKRAGRTAAEGVVELVHPRRRQDRRADRGQLRDRLRRPHRRLPEPGEGPGDAGRGGEPALRAPRGRAGGRPRAGAQHLRGAGGEQRQAGAGDREDRRRQGREVLRRRLPARAAVHQGPGQAGRPAGHRRGREAGREHRRAALRALPARRAVERTS